MHFCQPEPGVVPADQAYDAFMANTVRMARTLAQKPLDPLRVELTRRAPGCAARYQELYRCEVVFEAPANRLWFAAVLLDERLPAANAQLARMNDQIATEYLARFDKSQMALRVRDQLIKRLPSGEPPQRDIAVKLCLSLRQLQRRLQEEGTSFSLVLEETRRELAQQYLRQSGLSLGEITYLLGFRDQSNFTRAFKRWSGVTPGDFRAQA